MQRARAHPGSHLLHYLHSSKEKPKLRNATKLAGRSKQVSGWREDKAIDGLWKRCQLCHPECLHLNKLLTSRTGKPARVPYPAA